MSKRKMNLVPMPIAGNVLLVISDGQAYMSCEVTEKDLLEDGPQGALDFLRAELAIRPRAADPLQTAMQDVADYRNEKDRQQE